MNFPLVSIVMPSMNQARFIEASIDSVLSQDYANLELVVADGGSSDGTQAVLERMAARDGRLRWFSKPDSGPAEALNRALAQVRGTIVGWLNSDDLYTPTAIARAVSLLDAAPDVLMVYGHGEHVNESGGVLERYPTLPPQTPTAQFAHGCFICQPTVFFRRTQYVLLGKLDESLKCAFDFDYWLRAFRAFPERIGFVDAVQAQSRLHEDCITLRQRRAVMLEGMRVLARHMGHAPAAWVRTWAEELAAGKVGVEAGMWREQALALLAEARPLLRPEDHAALLADIRLDSRLAPTDLVSPAENDALAMQEYRDGVLRVSSTPRMLTLETTSRCNLRCVMCPHAIDAVQRPKHLPDDLVNSLKRVVRRAYSIQLHGIGEPIVSPAFWKVLPLLPEAPVCESSINTNLTQLGEQRLRNLLDSNLKIVNVSLDAASALTYGRIRGFDFDTVLNNLRELLLGRNERGQQWPLVYLNMTLMRVNIEELSDFVRLASELGVDKVVFWHLNRWSNDEMARYVVERDGWVFDYAKEGLWNFPELSNRCIRDAVALAKELGMPIWLDHNKEVFYDDVATESA